MKKRYILCHALLATGAAACVAAALVRPDWPLPKQKLYSLAAQYGFLFPAIALTARAAWGAAQEVQPAVRVPRFRTLVWTYVLVLLPMAAFLHPGLYSADESTYLFQARCLTAGALYTSPPSLSNAEVHFTHHLVLNGKWFGKYPFGWPVILALGSLIHLEWLLNPLLGLLLLWLAHRVGEALFSPSAAWYGALFLAASPFFTLNCLGYMSHVACGAAIAAATLCYFRAVRSGSVCWVAAMAACTASAILIRPYTAVWVGAVLGTAMLVKLRRRRSWLAICVAAVLPILGAIWVMGAVHQALTGHFAVSPYAAYRGLATPAEVSLVPDSLAHVLAKTTPIRLADTTIAAFPFVFLFAAYGAWRGRKERGVLVLILLFAVLVLGHLAQREDSDSPIGERYYWEGFFAVCLLAGAGGFELARRMASRLDLRRSIAVSTAVAAAASWAFFVRQQWTARWPYRAIAEAAAAAPMRSGVVFLMPAQGYEPRLYNLNRPGSKLLFIPDRGDGRRRQIAAKAGATRWAMLTYLPAEKRARWRLDLE